MKEKQITNHQLGVVLSLSIISLKVLIFPAVVGSYALNDCYLSVFLSLCVDFMFVMLLVYVIKKNPNKTFYEVLEGSLGKVISKIIVSLLAVFFVFKALMSIKELQNYFVRFLFKDIQWSLFVFPLIALLIYIMNKSFRTFARSAEFFYYLVVAGAILSVLLPVRELKLYNLLPFMANGAKPIIGGSFFTTFQFGDFLVLLLCMGRFEYTKDTPKTIIKFTLITDLFIMLFFIIFVALFGDMVVNQGLAVSDVPLYSNMASNNGRLEWFSIVIWTIVLISQTGLMLVCTVECVEYVTSIKSRFWISVGVSVVIFLLLYAFYLNFADAIKIVCSAVFASSFMAFKVLTMLFLLIASRGRKQYEKLN